jgi:hypothetical protein
MVLTTASPPPSTASSLRIEGYTHTGWDYLAVPPDKALRPNDPDREQKSRDWESWAVEVRMYRAWLAEEIKRHPGLEAIEWAKCAADPAYFINTYGFIFEPRTNFGRGGYNPWVLFPRQLELVRWFQACMAAHDETADGVIEKCRDVGASWIMVALFVHQWLFTSPFNGLFVSWKEEYVDSRAPRSLMWKMDKIIANLPTFLKPPGFNPAHHRMKLWLKNPANENTITGESTTSNTARGDRNTAIFFDEAPQIPDFMHIWMGTADVTDHRFAAGTTSLDYGPDYYNLCHGIDMEYAPSAFYFDYWQHPRHDNAWLERQRKRYAADPDEFETEIMRNPFVQSQFVYPTARDKQPDDGIMYIPGSPLWCAVDPGRDDNTAIIWIQFNMATQQYEVLDGYTNRLLPAAFYGPILAGSKTDLLDELVTGEWEYGDREEELIAWVATFTDTPQFIGDMHGANDNGASADTWYGVWNRNHGIVVNRDRLPSGKLAAHRMAARTHTGRRKSARWILPSVQFAGTIGARQALAMLQNNKLPRSPRSGKIPESGMLRDQTTHYTSAFEYWAANMDMQDQLMQYQNERQGRIDNQRLAELSGHRFGHRSRRTEVA